MSIQSEITRISGNVASAFAAVGNKGGNVPASKVSGNLASAINSIPEGVTVQRASGTFIPSGDAFTVNVGFQPDLVVLHMGEESGGNELHSAASFYEDTRQWGVQLQLASESGFYMFYIRPQVSGFAGNTWRIDNNWGWNSYGTPVSYVAVKYT